MSPPSDTTQVVAVLLMMLVIALLTYKVLSESRANKANRLSLLISALTMVGVFSVIYALKTSTAAVSTLQKTNAELVSSSHQLAVQKNQLLIDTETDKSRIESGVQELAELAAARGADQEKLGRLEDDLLRLNRRIIELESTNSSLHADNKNLGKLNATLAAENAELGEQLKQLQVARKTPAAEVMALGTEDTLPKLQRFEAENNLLKAQIDLLMEENRSLIQENTNLLIEYGG